MYSVKFEEPVLGKEELRILKVVNEAGVVVFTTRVQLELVEGIMMYIIRCNKLIMSNRGIRDKFSGEVRSVDSYAFINIGTSIYDHKCHFNILNMGGGMVLSIYIPNYSPIGYEIDINVIQGPSSVYH